ncbi:hypothetical protein ZWY2020_008698, partial [Hordeum vulgare]
TSNLDLGKIVPPAGFLFQRRAAVPSAPVLRGRSASRRFGLAVSVSFSNVKRQSLHVIDMFYWDKTESSLKFLMPFLRC